MDFSFFFFFFFQPSSSLFFFSFLLLLSFNIHCSAPEDRPHCKIYFIILSFLKEEYNHKKELERNEEEKKKNSNGSNLLFSFTPIPQQTRRSKSLKKLKNPPTSSQESPQKEIPKKSQRNLQERNPKSPYKCTSKKSSWKGSSPMRLGR